MAPLSLVGYEIVGAKHFYVKAVTNALELRSVASNALCDPLRLFAIGSRQREADVGGEFFFHLSLPLSDRLQEHLHCLTRVKSPNPEPEESG
jgi:hypothetical protein